MPGPGHSRESRKTSSISGGLPSSSNANTKEGADNNDQGTPSELDFVSLNNILEQLARKKSILKELNQKIAAILEDLAELEEIFDTEVIQEEIDETSS